MSIANGIAKIETFRASDFAHDGKKHLLLAASGSVATIKLPNILEALSHHKNLSVRLVLTESAVNFLQGQSAEQPRLKSLRLLGNVDGIYLDEDEWDKPWTRGAEILHIELRRWADLLAVVPLSADTMAKMALGMADNLLLSVLRAWDTTGSIDGGPKKTVMLAPAMNTAMWLHPVTKKHLAVLEGEWGLHSSPDGWVDVVRPMEKTLACGDTGIGAMEDWRKIVERIEQHLSLERAA